MYNKIFFNKNTLENNTMLSIRIIYWMEDLQAFYGYSF